MKILGFLIEVAGLFVFGTGFALEGDMAMWGVLVCCAGGLLIGIGESVRRVGDEQ